MEKYLRTHWDQTTPVTQLPRKIWPFFWYFFKQGHWKAYTAAWVISTLAVITTMSVPRVLKDVLDSVQSFDVAAAVSIFEAVQIPLMWLVGLTVGHALLRRVESECFLHGRPPMRAHMRDEMVDYLHAHSHNFFLNNFAGALAHKVAEVSGRLSDILMIVSFAFLPALISFFVAIFFVLQVHGVFAVMLTVWLVGYIALSLSLALRVEYYAYDYAKARSAITGQTVDGITGNMNVRLFARRAYERSLMKSFLDEEIETAKKLYRFMDNARLVQNMGAAILIIALFVFSLYYQEKGLITTGDLVMVITLGLLLIETVRGALQRVLEFYDMVGTVNEGIALITSAHEITDVTDAAQLDVTKGEIVFEDICFAHQNGTQVFEDLNITIQAGEKVGLIGFSGSGKSTFVNLMLRFFDIDKGLITVDGQDITNVTQDSLHEHIAMIPQEPLMFHRSIMENIRYGKPDATDAEVIAASKKAKADKFISELKEGYATLVGERGVKLSGGQRQRVAIARAILKDAPILLLDEATSALDSVTEKDIQESLNQLMQNRTVVVIAHRLSTIAHLDRVVVFDEGKIIENGTHTALLKEKGHYAKMWHMQAGGFLPESL